MKVLNVILTKEELLLSATAFGTYFRHGPLQLNHYIPHVDNLGVVNQLASTPLLGFSQAKWKGKVRKDTSF
jgi:hypothetical protein